MLLLTRDAAVLPHEFAHLVVVWIVGIKDRPGNIEWGGGSQVNIFLLINIDENVDYRTTLDADMCWQVALVAVTGPGIANGGLYLPSRRFITAASVTVRPLASCVLFRFLFMNLANLYDYVPIRVFAADGGVAPVRWSAAGVSRWLVFAVASCLVRWAIIDFYRAALPFSLGACGFASRSARATILIVATVHRCGSFAIPGHDEPDPVSLYISRTSLPIIPAAIAVNWRRIVERNGPVAGVQAQPA